MIYSIFLNYSVSSCGFVCDVPEISSVEKEAILDTNTYDINLQSQDSVQRLIYRHTVTTFLTNTTTPKIDQTKSRMLANDAYFNISATKISDSEIFFPAPKMYRLECLRDLNNGTCIFGNNDIFNESKNASEVTKFRVRVSHDAHTTTDDIKSYWVKAISDVKETKLHDDYNGLDSITCKDRYNEVI